MKNRDALSEGKLVRIIRTKHAKKIEKSEISYTKKKIRKSNMQIKEERKTFRARKRNTKDRLDAAITERKLT